MTIILAPRNNGGFRHPRQSELINSIHLQNVGCINIDATLMGCVNLAKSQEATTKCLSHKHIYKSNYRVLTPTGFDVHSLCVVHSALGN